MPANKPPNTEYEYKINDKITEIYLYKKNKKHTVIIDIKNLNKFLNCPYPMQRPDECKQCWIEWLEKKC